MCHKEKEEYEFQENEEFRNIPLPKSLESCRSTASCRECNKTTRPGTITWWKKLKHKFGIHTFEMTFMGFRYCFVCSTSEIFASIKEVKPAKRRK